MDEAFAALGKHPLVAPVVAYMLNFTTTPYLNSLLDDPTAPYLVPIIRNHTHSLPWLASLVYLVAIFVVLPRVVPQWLGKTAFIKYLSALWNLSLAVMSFCVLYGLGVPYFQNYVLPNGLVNTLCDEPHEMFSIELNGTYHPMMFWGWIFALSKFVELGDTVILLLKNPTRKLEFLHWYHHFTVLLFTWYSVAYKFSPGYAFTIMNAFVHSIMYLYYFFADMDLKPPTWVAFPITCFQILQMFGGIYVNVAWFLESRPPAGSNFWRCGCQSPLIMMAAGVFIYGTYLYLFLKFFVKRYIFGSAAPVRRSGSAAGPGPASAKGANKKPKTH